jgi:transcriptional regulator with GAF, ATPase, and Fis domain
LWRRAAGADTLPVYDGLEYPGLPHPDLPHMEAIPFIASKVEAGQATWFSRLDEVTEDQDREAFRGLDVRSVAVVPMAGGGAVSGWGALVVGSTTRERDWSPALITQLRLTSALFGQALARKASLNALQRTRDELQQMRGVVTAARDTRGAVFQVLRPRDHLQEAEPHIRRRGMQPSGPDVMTQVSPATRRMLDQAQQVAATSSTVLLLGETGTGKELIATHIHELSARRGRSMVRVNCAAIPNTLIESELFGREKGAFTGALARQAGRFELADRSTIFLDEIGDLPLDVQVKLLRVLEERLVERLGSVTGIRVDVRVIAATHRNLEKRIAEGEFREDLFYRLNVFPIQVPPLRDRPEEIPSLVWRFVGEFAKAFGKPIDSISRENMAALQQYAWPGNIRELRNVVERAMIVAAGPHLTITLPPTASAPGKGSARLIDVQKEHVRDILESTGWRIRGTNGAAERLGLRPTTLETRMAKLGLSRPKSA